MKKNGHHKGFLYHPDSQKILLQKYNADPSSLWTLLETSAGDNFQKVVTELLKLNLNAKNIFEIYDYSIDGKNHYIYYAEVLNLKDFTQLRDRIFSWFNFSEITKLPLLSQTKQDIIVGKRVIDSASRKKAGQLTIG